MIFPKIRMRDRRKDEATRRRFRETPEVSVRDLIMPVFVKEGLLKKKEIKSMPGIYQFSLKDAAREAKKIYRLGIPSVILFGIPKHKDEIGSAAYDDNGITQEAIRIIKKKAPKLTVIADVCMCEYTSHGHCGIINQKPGFGIDNDETIKILARIAVSYAKAGVDVVAPSAMIDGQVRAIKEALVKNGFSKACPVRSNLPKADDALLARTSNGVKIMSYSSKYVSSFYGPFRDAAESPPQFGDRKTYQMDYHNSDEAILEAKLDIGEGADMVMVKPALGYQDIIYRLKKELKFPLACYNVSGEYAMIKAAAKAGWLDEKKVVLEILTGFKRAGADKIITYHAESAAKWFKTRCTPRRCTTG